MLPLVLKDAAGDSVTLPSGGGDDDQSRIDPYLMHGQEVVEDTLQLIFFHPMILWYKKKKKINNSKTNLGDLYI